MRGLYIHIPFCKSKCKYCDFASFAGKEGLIKQYTDALCKEAQMYEGMSFDTVYIGGGTPTAVDVESFEKILHMVKCKFNISPDYEFTVEANPATITDDLASIMKKYGVNRVSLGAQTFIDSELATLGRIHTAADTEDTFYILRNAGFDNISLDLMFALPGQTTDTLSKSIQRVLNLSPEHISCYGLKIEPDTVFEKMCSEGRIAEKDEDEFADMYELVVSTLQDKGYERYEISNFARDGKYSRHNTKYWQCEEYLGLGLGASSYINGRRFSKDTKFDKYFKDFSLSEDYELSIDDKMSEFVILGLRLIKEGVSISRFKSLFDRDIYDVYGDTIRKFEKMNMLRVCADKIRLTDKACYVSNAILCEFV